MSKLSGASNEGTPACLEMLRGRSPGSGVINTTDNERLNATFRDRLAALTQRGGALVRRTVIREHGKYLVSTISNFCTPHESLGHPHRAQTPAMAITITDHVWIVEGLLSLHVPSPCWNPPKQRGPPAWAMKRLLEQWCSWPRLSMELPNNVPE